MSGAESLANDDVERMDATVMPAAVADAFECDQNAAMVYNIAGLGRSRPSAASSGLSAAPAALDAPAARQRVQGGHLAAADLTSGQCGALHRT